MTLLNLHFYYNAVTWFNVDFHRCASLFCIPSKPKRSNDPVLIYHNYDRLKSSLSQSTESEIESQRERETDRQTDRAREIKTKRRGYRER